jgi:hypothetical protein
MLIDVLGKNEENLFGDYVRRIPFSSVQSSLNWRNLISEMKDEPYFIIAKEKDEIKGVLPLYFFENRFANILTSNSWNTISGILCKEKNYLERKRVYDALIDYSISLAHELDCSTLTIGTNPFEDYNPLYSSLQPDCTLENFIQYIRIKEIFDGGGIFSHPNYTKRTNLSRNLAKLEEHRITISDEEKQEYIDEAFNLQKKRMNELNACPFPKEFFNSALKNILKKQQGKFIFAFYEEKMIATCFFLYSRDLIDVYMLCMDTDYKKFGPNFAITKYLLEWAFNKNVPILNWMSSPLRGEGVYKWKEQWGSRDRSFLYMTRITGDISVWKKLTIEELADAYRFHYLLPFNLLNTPNTPIITTKDEVAAFIHCNQS